MFGMWIWWLVGLIVIVALVWAVLRASGRGTGGTAAASPEERLKQRYANGEIDEEEYGKRLRDLRK